MNEPPGGRKATRPLSLRSQGEPVWSSDAGGGGPHSALKLPLQPPLYASPRGGRPPGGAYPEPSPAAKPGLRVATASPAPEARPLSPGLQVHIGRLPGVWGDRRHSAARAIQQHLLLPVSMPGDPPLLRTLPVLAVQSLLWQDLGS